MIPKTDRAIATKYAGTKDPVAAEIFPMVTGATKPEKANPMNMIPKLMLEYLAPNFSLVKPG